MDFGPEIDRQRARLSEPARMAVRHDERRIVVVGARGWIGKVLLSLLNEALDPADFADRVVCFGSTEGEIALEDGLCVKQQPLSALAALPYRSTLLFHLAFLTKDKVAGMAEADYVAANRNLSQTVVDALDPIGVDRLFLASSGAAAFADDEAAAMDLRLYGRLKRDDEALFSDWAKALPATRRAAIGRIYNVSGPYINKHDAYALASFILDALAGRPIEVRAPMRVIRGYVPVRELISFVLVSLLKPDGEIALHFETGGEALELGEVASRVAARFGVEVRRRPVTEPRDNRYVGDAQAWERRLAGVGMAPAPLIEQIAETAAFLARTVAA